MINKRRRDRPFRIKKYLSPAFIISQYVLILLYKNSTLFFDEYVQCCTITQELCEHDCGQWVTSELRLIKHAGVYSYSDDSYVLLSCNITGPICVWFIMMAFMCHDPDGILRIIHLPPNNGIPGPPY